VLKQRVLTAVALVAVLLGVMLGLPPVFTTALITLLVIIGAWEWAGFIGDGGREIRVVFTTAVAVAIAGAFMLWTTLDGFVEMTLVTAMAWWFVAFLWVCLAPARVNPYSAALAGLLALVPCWFALFYLMRNANGTWWVLFTLALVWAADTGAFFAGRWFGRVPLAPRVSPKKTWEGVLGGILLSGLVAWVGARWVFEVDVAPFVTMCVAVAALSIVGDLTESMFKRLAGVKDSGTLLPGHGGVLDRIDALLPVLPLAMLLMG